MWAIATAFTPFFTTELRAPSGKSPVIVQGPDCGNVVFFYVRKEHVDIEIIVTHRMDMYQIGFDLFQFANEKPGVNDIEIAIETKKCGQSFRDDSIQPCPDIDLIFVFIT